jgi:hypothetical protein
VHKPSFVRRAGLKPYELWLKPAEWQAVKRLIERLRARKNEPTHPETDIRQSHGV